MHRTPRNAFRLVLGLGLGLLLAGNASAGARDELVRFTSGLKGLEGQFSQQVFDANGRAKEKSSGTVAVAAPRLFRWEYTKPFAQLIVADGQKVWIYEPDLEQATVKPQGEEERNSPLVALFDPARLDRQFDVSEEADRQRRPAVADPDPEGRRRNQLPDGAPGLRRAGPGADAGAGPGRPEDRDQLPGLEAQPGLRRHHLQVHPGSGRGRGRRMIDGAAVAACAIAGARMVA
jgi:periplasmic chaperone LolA